MMDLQLKGRNAVILGGTRGIGRAIADTLAAEGCAVALCARDPAAVSACVTELQAAGGTATGASVDVCDRAALTAWLEAVAAELGGIDILISNAGAMAQGFDEAAWRANFDLDLIGAVNAVTVAMPHLQMAASRTGDAAVVIISSVSATSANTADSYGAIKAALIHMAKGLARQHAKDKVRVNVVSPGMVYFEGGVWHKIEQNAPEFFRKAVARNPTGRCATPQEIANAAVFLASPVSSYTTGISMLVDGAVTDRVNF
jgi:3-oxoacyl-[acyl-carrier protein] reductase